MIGFVIIPLLRGYTNFQFVVFLFDLYFNICDFWQLYFFSSDIFNHWTLLTFLFYAFYNFITVKFYNFFFIIIIQLWLCFWKFFTMSIDCFVCNSVVFLAALVIVIGLPTSKFQSVCVSESIFNWEETIEIGQNCCIT